jgi:site-specific DNA recombinase
LYNIPIMIKAVIYSRVSTQDQDNQRQIQELKDYAKYQKIQIESVFEEKVSGATKAKERKAFNDLLQYIKDHHIKLILVWELSRLGRSMLDVQINIEELSNAGVNIYIKKEGLNTLDESGNVALLSKMMIGMLTAFAEFERQTTKKRSSSGLRQRASLGGAGGGVVKPYGFKNENKLLVIDQEEAKIVQLIFQKYLEGLGTTSIATFLNQKKVPTRYNKAFADKSVKSRLGYEKKGSSFHWQDGTIYSILKNSIYYGDRKYKGEIFNVPAIVSKQTFDLVQGKLKSNFNKPNSEKKYENVLAGLIICPKCGKNYYMHKRDDNNDNAYKCISKRYKEYCGNPSINIDKLNNALYWTCQPLILNDSLLTNTDNIKTSIENKELELSNVNNEIKKQKNRQKKIQQEYFDEGVSKLEYESLKAKSETEIEVLNEKALRVNREIDGLQNLKKNSKKTYNHDMFKTYLKDAVQSIKVFEIAKPERFSQMYAATNDVPLLIQVKSNLLTSDGSPVVLHFSLTRYSDNYASVGFDKDGITDFEKEISKGKFYPDSVFQLSELKPLQQLQNKYFRKP